MEVGSVGNIGGLEVRKVAGGAPDAGARRTPFPAGEGARPVAKSWEPEQGFTRVGESATGGRPAFIQHLARFGICWVRGSGVELFFGADRCRGGAWWPAGLGEHLTFGLVLDLF